jgi:large subunit ribosomal protein L2
MSVLKVYNPTTPGRRGLVLLDRSALWKGSPVKSLSFGCAKTAGRNAAGRITSMHRGGGHRKVLRIVDLSRRSKLDCVAVVERIEYDPNRSAHLALIKYKDDSSLAYIIAPAGLKPGDEVVSTLSDDVSVKPGNAMKLKNIPIGIDIHNVELHQGRGGQIARSAGSSARIMGFDGGFALIKLLSGELKSLKVDCLATIGVVSNSDAKNTTVGKAGRTRWKGRRPVVRGVAMNPVDHPHGGGEGKTSGGRHPCTRSGLRKGTKTRSKKKPRLNYVRTRS